MANIDQKPNKFGSRKRGISVLPIIFSSVLAAGALAGSGVGIWHIASNYTESPEFTRSVKGRLQIDPFANYSEAEKVDFDLDDATRVTQECAQKLSRWLKDQGQKSYDVSYECYESEDDPDEFDCFLTAQFEIDKVYRKHYSSEEEKKEKIDNDQYLSFFSDKGFNSNEKTFVYRWWTQDESQQPVYSVIPYRQVFDIPSKVDEENPKVKTLVDKNGGNGVLFSINGDSKTLMKEIFTDLAEAKKFTQQKTNEEIKNFCQPRLYIVNNLDGLYNEVNYHLANWGNQNYGKDRAYLNLYEDSAYAKFSDAYKNKDYQGVVIEGGKSDDLACRLQPAKDHDSEEQEIQNADIFNYIDQATPGTNEVDFTNKYVDDIVTMDNFNNFIPQEITEDYKNDVNFESWEINSVDYFWFSEATKNLATTYLNSQIKYGFGKSTIKTFDLSDVKSYNKSFTTIIQDRFQSIYVAPSFTETIFGGSSLVGILSLGFLIFLVALLIILAVLYRTTGVMSWICMIFALSMTGLIATISSTAISMSLLFGLFTMAMVGFLASLAICGRMKRRLNSHEDTQLIVKKTFKQSLLPITDISVITLIFGVCFTYIAPVALNSLGLVLIIGAFMTFISVYLFNGLLHALLFNNQRTFAKFGFFGKPSNIANEMLYQSNNAVPASMDATRLELAFYSSMSKKKIDSTSKKAMIAVIVVGALLVVGIIIFSVLGFTSSTMFHTSNCLAINTDQDVIGLGWVSGLSYTSYYHDVTNGWWYFYTNASNINEVAQSIAEKITEGKLGVQVLVQNIVGSTNRDILDFALISILVATLCSSIYGAIRFNWIAFVPMLAGSFGLPLLILGLAAICQVKFDQFVVIGFVFVVVVNTIFTSTMVGNINSAWSRKDAYNKQEFKYIVNVALANNWTYIWTSGLAYLIFIVVFALTAPIGVASIIALLIIGGVVTIAIAPFTLSFLDYQFMKVRNAALSRIVERNKNKIVVNYDDIDEQGIEGINQFTKHIPISQEQKPQGE